MNERAQGSAKEQRLGCDHRELKGFRLPAEEPSVEEAAVAQTEQPSEAAQWLLAH